VSSLWQEFHTCRPALLWGRRAPTTGWSSYATVLPTILQCLPRACDPSLAGTRAHQGVSPGSSALGGRRLASAGPRRFGPHPAVPTRRLPEPVCLSTPHPHVARTSGPLQRSVVWSPYGRSPPYLWEKSPVPMGEVLPYLWEKSPVPMGEVLPYLREKSPVPMGEIMPYNLLLFEGLGPRDFQTDFQRRHTHTHNRVCAAQHERGCKGNRRCANLPGQPYQGYPVRPN
jgi:hypothetical protein